MKRLTCEMCGSTDLIKENGVFVCQSCGCKYSVEEAKKMMIEGTVDVSGSTVKVDNQQKLANLRKLADRAKEENDSETAARYFEQILIEDPNDWEANFYTIYYGAHNTTIAQMGAAANRITNCLGSVLNVIKETIDDKNKQKEAYFEIRDRVVAFEGLIVNNASGHIGSSLDTVKQNINNWLVPGITMLVKLGDLIAGVFEDYDTAATTYAGAKQHSTVFADMTTEMRILDSQIQQRIKSVNSLKAQKQKVEWEAKEKERKEREKNRYEEYWATHEDQKRSLEQEKRAIAKEIDTINAELNEEIARINNEKPDRDYTKEIKEKNAEIEQLESYLRSLGFFKMKEKKVTQEKIEAVQRMRDELSSKEREALRQTNGRIADAKRAAQYRIKPLQDRINAITTELTKPR